VNDRPVANRRADVERPQALDRATVVHPSELRAYTLHAGATNRLATMVAPGAAGGALSLMLEIFEPGGRQDENRHPRSAEVFYFIEGEGVAHSDGAALLVRAGDVLVLPAGSSHWIENTGTARLYALTTLVVDDGSHDRAGRVALPLDERDVGVLAREVAPT